MPTAGFRMQPRRFWRWKVLMKRRSARSYGTIPPACTTWHDKKSSRRLRLPLVPRAAGGSLQYRNETLDGGKNVAREGYLILDSDLHLMEPEDLWSRFMDKSYQANLPRFFDERQRQPGESAADKANADIIFGMQVQGLTIPAFGKSAGEINSARELRR